MELIPLISAYLVCSAGLGIATGKLIARRQELTVKAPAPPAAQPPSSSARAKTIRL
jgi:hypothetical protein